ncbi:MAG: 4Fe-4S dicluster domain-containing protein [Acidobacteria bacterium]|nr:4Fe-4S dicluster domain-containing protein [Acidobacteriota bacterium]
MLRITLLLIVAALVVGALVLWIVGERGRLLLGSTRRFFREGGRLHGYVYGRWTRQYIDVLLNRLPANPKATHWLADRYHGKVLTHDHATALVGSDKDVPLQDLDQVVPYPVARNLVLKGPPDVAVYECVCRHARESHCQPTQVCMVIGQPFVDFVLEHHPDTARRLNQQEALELLADEHQRGHVHAAWFKDAMLDRFYAICNCCKCCCAGIQQMRLGTPMMTPSGYVAEHKSDLCGECGTCVEACPFNALSMDGARPRLDFEKCLGCGVCEVKCPNQAVALVRDERKGIPLDVRALAG